MVTAHYDGKEDAVVTDYSVSTPDMSTAGTKTVTVTYTEDEITKTATYTITVLDKEVPPVDESEPDESEPVESEDSSSEQQPAKKKGCGGSILATSVILSVLAISGGVILISKKRKED